MTMVLMMMMLLMMMLQCFRWGWEPGSVVPGALPGLRLGHTTNTPSLPLLPPTLPPFYLSPSSFSFPSPCRFYSLPFSSLLYSSPFYLLPPPSPLQYPPSLLILPPPSTSYLQLLPLRLPPLSLSPPLSSAVSPLPPFPSFSPLLSSSKVLEYWTPAFPFSPSPKVSPSTLYTFCVESISDKVLFHIGGH